MVRGDVSGGYHVTYYVAIETRGYGTPYHNSTDVQSNVAVFKVLQCRTSAKDGAHIQCVKNLCINADVP